MDRNEVQGTKHAIAWMEPIHAYQKLRDQDPLLLDGMGKHPDARHAYLALGGRLDVRYDGDAWELTHDDGRTEARTGEPLSVLQTILDEWRFASNESSFIGGFVGYFGYEFVAAVEPTLRTREASTPQVALRLCRDVIVFDRLARTATLWVHDLPGESGADDRAAAIRVALAGDGPIPELQSAPRHWAPSMDEPQFVAAVDTVREHVRTGDLFQANIATRFQAPWAGDPVALYEGVRQANPSPYMALLDWGDHVIVSNSPEQLFGVEGGIIRARPIAGTRPRDVNPTTDEGYEQQLLGDPKEQAEHTMLVDLLRNDVAKVSRPGTVRVTERGSVERYQRVMHLVSCVAGEVAPGSRFVDWFRALFPGGTITGAPKHRACMRIHEAEPVARGPYTGSAGFLSWDHSCTQWNIMIRTMLLQGGLASVHAGSGIVAGSEPHREWREAGHKARSLLDAAAGGPVAQMPRLGDVTAHGAWTPPSPPGRVNARVLLIDNYDSFVHNLADYCGALGAEVRVIRNDADLDAERAEFDPTHVILSPGPGWPAQAGGLPRVAKEWLGRVPMLGVCLGHQALAEATGATIRIAKRPVHGETDAVHQVGGVLHQGLPEVFTVARYHSLVVDEAGLSKQWNVTARLADGTVMAMENASAKAFGLQYHPESIGTDHGLDILIRFLGTP